MHHLKHLMNPYMQSLDKQRERLRRAAEQEEQAQQVRGRASTTLALIIQQPISAQEWVLMVLPLSRRAWKPSAPSSQHASHHPHRPCSCGEEGLLHLWQASACCCSSSDTSCHGRAPRGRVADGLQTALLAARRCASTKDYAAHDSPRPALVDDPG